MSEGTPTAGDTAGSATSAEKTARYTDSDMARMRRKLEGEIEKARTEALSGLVQDMGFDDPDTLRSFVEERRSGEDRATSELKKLQRENKQLARQLEEISQTHQATLKQWHGEKIRAEVVASAEAAVKPDQVYRLLSDGFTIGDDGAVIHESGKPVADVVAGYLKDNPHLARPSGGGQGGGSQPATEGADKGPDLLTPEGRAANLAAKGFGIA